MQGRAATLIMLCINCLSSEVPMQAVRWDKLREDGLPTSRDAVIRYLPEAGVQRDDGHYKDMGLNLE